MLKIAKITKKDPLFEAEVECIMRSIKRLDWNDFIHHLLEKRDRCREIRNTQNAIILSMENEGITPPRLVIETKELFNGYYNAYRDLIEEIRNETFSGN